MSKKRTKKDSKWKVHVLLKNGQPASRPYPDFHRIELTCLFMGPKKPDPYIYIYIYIFNQVNEFKSHFAWSYFEMLWWKNLRRLLIIFSISKALLKVINFIFKDVGIFQPFSPNTTMQIINFYEATT